MELSLESMAQFFRDQEFDCTILPATEEIPRDYLFIHLGTDAKSRDLILQINLTKQELSSEDRIEEIEGDIDHIFHLQMMLQLPYAVKDECIGDLSRLLLLINKASDIPGLEFSEVDRTLFWRHVMLINGSSLDPYVMVTLLGTVFIIVNVFGPFIEAVAVGEKSFEVTVNEIRGQQKNVG